MADDDDTSAGLTPASSPTPRRRASRSAGPPKPEQVAAPTAVAESVVGESSVAESSVAETGSTASESVAPPSDVRAAEAAAGQAVSDETIAGPGVQNESGESEESENEAGEDEAVVSAPASRSRRGLLAWILTGVLVVALAASAVWLLMERSAAHDRDAQRNAFVQTARQTVINLTTIKPDTAKEDVDKILAGASGEFRSEFDGREDPFVSVVKEAGVTTVGKVLEAGFESQDGNTAKVLVAARADVTTPDGAQNGPRDFRMRVTVTDDGGTMTASKVEFVP